MPSVFTTTKLLALFGALLAVTIPGAAVEITAPNENTMSDSALPQGHHVAPFQCDGYVVKLHGADGVVVVDELSTTPAKFNLPDGHVNITVPRVNASDSSNQATWYQIGIWFIVHPYSPEATMLNTPSVDARSLYTPPSEVSTSSTQAPSSTTTAINTNTWSTPPMVTPNLEGMYSYPFPILD